jgi:hypothetical protein
MAMTKAHLGSIMKIKKPEEVPIKAKNYPYCFNIWISSRDLVPLKRSEVQVVPLP